MKKKILCELFLSSVMGMLTPSAFGLSLSLPSALGGSFQWVAPPEAYLARIGSAWRGGTAKRIYSITWNKAELLDIGYVHTWDINHGQPAYGVMVNKEASLNAIAGIVSDISNIPGVTPPAWISYIGNITGLGVNVSYLPQPPAGTKPYIWGYGFTINLSDAFAFLSGK